MKKSSALIPAFQYGPPPPEPPKPEIGFHVKEDAVPYRTKRKVTS